MEGGAIAAAAAAAVEPERCAPPAGEGSLDVNWGDRSVIASLSRWAWKMREAWGSFAMNRSSLSGGAREETAEGGGRQRGLVAF